MRACDGCGRLFEPRSTRHRFCRAECRHRSGVGPNRLALELAIHALATGPEHLALMESARSLADLVDRLERFDDKAWREYRLALKALWEAVTDGSDDPVDKLLDELRAEVLDSEGAEP